MTGYLTCLHILPAVLSSHSEKHFRYEKNWESLSRHPVPEWFMDAKFGIYTHWGVYCVPAFDNEWYPRNMYQDGSRANQHHVRTHGPLSTFGYKDFIPMFTARHFDPDMWAELFYKAGARFAGPVAEHHDGFSMWASRVNRWNAMDMGPRRDVVGELMHAIRKQGMRTIVSFHHHFFLFDKTGFFKFHEGWDTAAPQYADLYQKRSVEEEQRVWFEKVREVIDTYQPDQIWLETYLKEYVPDDCLRRLCAYYYNEALKWDKQVIITRKFDDLPKGVGVLDIERSKMDHLPDYVWQTDDSIAVNSWCWVEDLQLKPARELIHDLIDIVSKNGVLLLNICPKADGTIPEDQQHILLDIGHWLQINGEAIYNTRPWHTHGDGPNQQDSGRGFHGEPVAYTPEDIRYTCSKDGKTLYALFLGHPHDIVPLFSVKANAMDGQVSMLGYPGVIKHHITSSGRLVIEVPEAAPECSHAVSFKLEGFKPAIHPEAVFCLQSGSRLTPGQAVLFGECITIEKRNDLPENIGRWDSPDDSVHWLVRIPQSGKYVMHLKVAAMKPSRLALDVANQTLEVDVPGGESWDAANIVHSNTITFTERGVYHLTLRAADPINWHAVNVWEIQIGGCPTT